MVDFHNIDLPNLLLWFPVWRYSITSCMVPTETVLFSRGSWCFPRRSGFLHGITRLPNVWSRGKQFCFLESLDISRDELFPAWDFSITSCMVPRETVCFTEGPDVSRDEVVFCMELLDYLTYGPEGNSLVFPRVLMFPETKFSENNTD